MSTDSTPGSGETVADSMEHTKSCTNSRTKSLGSDAASPEEARAAAITDEMTTSHPVEPARVWTASSLERAPQEPGRRPLRRSTLVWALVLLVTGGLLIAFGFGVHIDPITTGIVLLAGIGSLMLVAALLPRGDRTRP